MPQPTPQTQKINLKGLTHPKLEDLIMQWNEPKYRAKQVMSWLYDKRVTRFDAMTNLSKAFRSKLAAEAYISDANTVAQTVADDGATVKYLFELTDQNRVESVLMYEGARVTVCVSSQVGCAMACEFCATGKMGFFRNLTAAEILDQLMAIESDQKQTVTNIVFMGMGEPLANYDETVDAIRVMCSPDGLGLSEKRITVSSVGLVPRIRQFTKEGLKCNLALSLNATTDTVRTRLMPINAKYPIDEALDAAREWAIMARRKVTLEYVLIRDINDSVADANRLRRLMSGLPCKLNLIPFNEIQGSEFRRPNLVRIEQFRQTVAAGHYVAPIRFSKGRNIAAACGQLRTIYDRQGAVMPSRD